MSVPFDEAAFSDDPLIRAQRHMDSVVGLAAQAEGADLERSNFLRREQLAHLEFARTHAAVAQAEDTRRIADALDRLAPKEKP